MKLRVTLVRPRGDAEDVAITADATARVGDIARTIVVADPQRAHDGAGEATLEVFSTIGQAPGRVLDPETTLAHVEIAAGAALRVVPTDYAQRSPVGELRITQGPAAGASWPLTRGAFSIGRDAACDIVIDDPLVSKRHARLEVGPDRIELVDANSANGVLVDGAAVPHLASTRGRITAVLGDSVVEIRVTVADPDTAAAIAPRQIPFVRSPRVERRYLGEELAGTDLPVPPRPQPFPWLALVAPMLMGATLFAVTGSAISLVFVALSPILMIGTWLTARMNAKAQLRDDKARFEQQLERLTSRLDAERREEASVRRAEVPELDAVCADAVSAGPLVWTRRVEHWSFLHVRLGLGAATSRNTVADSSQRDRAFPEYLERLDAVVEEHRLVPGVPILESLPDAGALGIAGSTAAAAGAARALLAQVGALHAPADVVIAGFVGASWTPEFADSKWMPHTWAAEEMLGTASLADNPATGARLLAQLEEIVEARGRSAAVAERLGAQKEEDAATRAGASVGETRAQSAGVPTPAIVVLITPDAPADLGRLIQLSERAAGRGVLPVWIGATPADLPAACRTWLHVPAEGDSSAHFVRLGESVAPLTVDSLDPARFAVVARALGRLTDVADVAHDEADVPRTVSLVHLLGREAAEQAEAVIDRWTQNHSIAARRAPGGRGYQPKLRALVGQTGQGALHLDLRAQGPHALVGGTTGSGKSEFLQAWVLGMAAEYSPERVTFLFVDYKGGSAFADCIRLPHSVGLVTDLNPHLVRRVLVSLRAELHHRERLFNRKKAKDLLELEKAADPDAPPALVLVIDEFAALAKEVPEFVDGVVDIAQRGRSLGIHLIMATQRPAGVIKDNLRANTNLRVALRMADETDSDDVIGSADAALFDPGLPGRGIAKTGPGRTTLFQSAYTGGWSLDETDETVVEVRPFGLADAPAWPLPEPPSSAEDAEDLGPNDQQLLVERMVQAAREAALAAPRRPWLDELAPTFDQTLLPQRTDAALVMGVIDLPERQEQTSVAFLPDDEGHVAVFGTGGSGKSVVLRTLAISAGITPRGGPVHVYGIDAAAGGLRMLEPLPHVGAVISGDDAERIERLFGMLRHELDRRGDAYAAVGASSLTEYRTLAGMPDEPRLLVLIDGFPAFRTAYEAVTGRADTYRALQQVLSDGRALGIHVALTADRGQSVPSALQAMIQRRVVLRMTDDDAYSLLGVPRDILSSDAVPGRAIIDDHEAQIAVIGGTRSTKEQATAIERMAASMIRRGRTQAPPILSLPQLYGAGELPAARGDQVVIGLADTDLGPFAIDPSGTFIVSGPPASGRSNAVAAIAAQVVRARPGVPAYFIGNPRSPVVSAVPWRQVAPDASRAMAALAEAEERADAGEVPLVAIEGIGEFANSLIEMPLSNLVKRAARGEVLLVVEGEIGSWNSNFGLFGELKAARRGIILQPETIDGEVVLKAPFPRLQRGEFPVGRGILAQRGKLVRLHLPLVVPAT
jgi:S-DNA-T family DNA segregation ATPase FtsK/SpoIIIE